MQHAYVRRVGPHPAPVIFDFLLADCYTRYSTALSNISLQTATRDTALLFLTYHSVLRTPTIMTLDSYDLDFGLLRLRL